MKAKPEEGNYAVMQDGTVKKILEVKTATSIKLSCGEWFEEEDIKEILVPKTVSTFGDLLAPFKDIKTNGNTCTKHEFLIKTDTTMREGEFKFEK